MNIWKKSRMNAGLTLRDISEKRGISKDILHNIESGRTSRIDPNLIYELSDLYNVDYFELMEAAGYKVPKERNKRLSHFQGLPNDIHNKAVAFVKYLKHEKEIDKLLDIGF